MWRKPVIKGFLQVKISLYLLPTLYPQWKLQATRKSQYTNEKENTPNKRNTHTVKTETCWKWLKLVEVDSPRVFVLSFFNVFVSISQETSISERDVTVAGCTPTETQLTQLRATTANEITTVLKVIGTKNLDDRKKTTVKFLLLFMPIVCPDSHIYFTF